MDNTIPISAKTKIFCVIGHPISHSFSPLIHNYWFKNLGLDSKYIALNVDPNQLKQATKGLKALNIEGFNITLPHKEKIIRLIDNVDSLAQDIGAVNTVKNENGYLIGRNTDAIGGKQALLDAGCQIENQNVLVLGAGGAAKAICFALVDVIDNLVIANRTLKRATILAKELMKKKDIKIKVINIFAPTLKKELENIDLLINTTPIGIYPNKGQSPISKDVLHNDLFIFDLVYNPLETQLLKDATSIGCKSLGGLDMLINQGALAFEWWTNKKPNINGIKTKIIEIFGKN